ncbi:hypothetical protein ANN_20991 [Periplaneta americana]|uniref:Peptidase S1 domain-containing protein n=1 Tax=Periplaneta americana TaxID=6978 RepID=A0ABQ8SE49_PERAM|nr:hypothetical protein ANN_20991 [Periplaneta americana]
MVGLCEGGNEPVGSLKAICNETPADIELLAGDVYLSASSSSAVIRKVAEILVHQQFRAMDYRNDVALLRLSNSLVMDGVYISAIKVRREPVTPGTICVVAGWGVDKEGETVPSAILRFVNLQIVARHSCSSDLGVELHIGELCAGSPDGDADSCQGDSGAPLVCGGQLTGLVSRGEGCGLKNKPGLYVDIAHYRSWIQGEIQNIHRVCKRSPTFSNLQHITWQMYQDASRVMRKKNYSGVWRDPN